MLINKLYLFNQNFKITVGKKHRTVKSSVPNQGKNSGISKRQFSSRKNRDLSKIQITIKRIERPPRPIITYKEIQGVLRRDSDDETDINSASSSVYQNLMFYDKIYSTSSVKIVFPLLLSSEVLSHFTVFVSEHSKILSWRLERSLGTGR